MKLKRLLSVGTISIAAAVALLTGVVYAASGNRVVQGVTNHSVYEAGDTVTVNGVVNGDVFCAGQTITINATVSGDVLCAGQTIDINGTVAGNVRLAGQNVSVNSRVLGSASIAAQSATINSSANVGRDLSLAGQNVTVDGRIGRDITGAVAATTLGGFVGRNVLLQTGSLMLASGANISGNVQYTGPKKLHKDGGAQVHGTVTYHQAAAHHNHAFNFFWFKALWLLAMIVFGVVLVALFPRVFRDWNVEWGAEFWWSVLTGFVAMFVVPAIILVLMVTLIGIPLGLFLLLLWLAAAMFAAPLAAYFTGSLIASRRDPILMLLIGAVVLAVLDLLPFIGWLVGLVAYWLGTGMLLRGLKRRYRKPEYKPVKAEETGGI